MSPLRSRASGAAMLVLAARAATADVVTISTRAFQLRDDVTPPISQAQRKFSYTSRTLADPVGHRVIRPDFGSPNDPTIAGAVMTIYNANGSDESFTAVLPAERWRQEGAAATGRYVYYGSYLASNPPITKIYVKHDKITIRGGQGTWGYTLDEPSQGKLALTLQLGAGDVWCIEALPKPPAATFDKPGRFLAKTNTPAPSVCPPAP